MDWYKLDKILHENGYYLHIQSSTNDIGLKFWIMNGNEIISCFHHIEELEDYITKYQI